MVVFFSCSQRRWTTPSRKRPDRSLSDTTSATKTSPLPDSNGKCLGMIGKASVATLLRFLEIFFDLATRGLAYDGVDNLGRLGNL